MAQAISCPKCFADLYQYDFEPNDAEVPDLDGGTLRVHYIDVGPRDAAPVVFIHGGMGDECAAIVTEPALVGKYRVIDYHRRGWGNSSPAEGPVSIPQHAADCRALIGHIGREKGNELGKSFVRRPFRSV